MIIVLETEIKKEFPGKISGPGDAGKYECNEYTYTLTEITKEELLDELKYFKIG